MSAPNVYAPRIHVPLIAQPAHAAGSLKFLLEMYLQGGLTAHQVVDAHKHHRGGFILWLAQAENAINMYRARVASIAEDTCVGPMSPRPPSAIFVEEFHDFSAVEHDLDMRRAYVRRVCVHGFRRIHGPRFAGLAVTYVWAVSMGISVPTDYRFVNVRLSSIALRHFPLPDAGAVAFVGCVNMANIFTLHARDTPLVPHLRILVYGSAREGIVGKWVENLFSMRFLCSLTVNSSCPAMLPRVWHLPAIQYLALGSCVSTFRPQLLNLQTLRTLLLHHRLTNNEFEKCRGACRSLETLTDNYEMSLAECFLSNPF